MLNWLRTGRRPLWAAAVVMVLIILALLIKPTLTFATAQPQNSTLVAALIALLGILATQIVNTILARVGQRNQQDLEDRRAQAARFQAYLEQMEKLLIDHQLRSASETSDNLPMVDGGVDLSKLNEGSDARVVAQAQTLAVLEGESDPTRRGTLLLFLHEAALINKDNSVIKLVGANLRGANPIGADLSEANLFRANLREANLSEANLSGADLSEATLWGANLWGANLFGADLKVAYLQGANLKEATLWGTNLQGATLQGANLKEANLWGANLQGATLWGANLFRANLFRANLQGANLQGANLQGANLQGANLKEATLQGARGFTREQFEQAIGDKTTELPEGVDPPTSWTQGEDKQTDGKE